MTVLPCANAVWKKAPSACSHNGINKRAHVLVINNDMFILHLSNFSLEMMDDDDH